MEEKARSESYRRRRRSSLLDRAIMGPALIESFTKLDPRWQARNPVMFVVEVGAALRDTDGANVVVMGCAGMARYRKPLQDAIGIPVVEPTQAAVAMAIGRVRLNWAGS